MKKFLFLLIFSSNLAFGEAKIGGLGFLKIGEQKNIVRKNLKETGAKLLPTSYEHQPHPSMQPLKYENVKLTPVFLLDDVELFFHQNKLFKIYVEANPNPTGYNPVELAEMYRKLNKFDNVISAIKEKYTFILDKMEEKIIKSEESGCEIDLLIKQKTWKIPTKVGLDAIYLEQRIFHPETKIELKNKDIDSDVCHESPFNALYIYDVKVLNEVDALMNKAIMEQEQEQIHERQKALEDL